MLALGTRPIGTGPLGAIRSSGANTALTANTLSHTLSLNAATLSTSVLISGVGLAHNNVFNTPAISQFSGLIAASITHTHSIIDSAIISGVVLASNAAEHIHALSTPTLEASGQLVGASLAHTLVLSAATLTLEIFIGGSALTHTNALSASIVDAGANLSASALTHIHSLAQPTLVTQIPLVGEALVHTNNFSEVTVSTVSVLAVNSFTHIHVFGVPLLNSTISLTSATLTHALTLSSTGVQIAVASDLIQAVEANKPLLSSVPGTQSAAAGFNSFLFDATDSLSCEFNTAGTPVFYAWLDDGTEQTSYTSATGGVLTFNIPAGRKLLLAVAHPSSISLADLTKFRALATAIRTY